MIGYSDSVTISNTAILSADEIYSIETRRLTLQRSTGTKMHERVSTAQSRGTLFLWATTWHKDETHSEAIKNTVYSRAYILRHIKCDREITSGYRDSQYLKRKSFLHKTKTLNLKESNFLLVREHIRASTIAHETLKGFRLITFVIPNLDV